MRSAVPCSIAAKRVTVSGRIGSAGAVQIESGGGDGYKCERQGPPEGTGLRPPLPPPLAESVAPVHASS